MSKPPFNYINEEFLPYIEVYSRIKYEELGLGTRYIPAEFYSVSDKYLGQCRVSNGARYITINKMHWDFLDESSKYELIFHEMIHCDTDGFVQHIDLPGHIMNAIHQNISNPENALRLYFRSFL
jgi:hypothetical protein